MTAEPLAPARVPETWPTPASGELISTPTAGLDERRSRVDQRSRTRTGADRVARMPDFLIIGAYKSGTTSLVDYLGQHPGIFLPDLQEPNYFAFSPEVVASAVGNKPEIEWEGVYRRPRARNLAQYESLFVDAPATAVVGECSPEYLRNPVASGRIQAELPGVKLLAILRNPVERTLSDYSARVRDSLETESLEVVIDRSMATAEAAPQAAVNSESLNAKGYYDYLETGFYGRQLRRYIETFPSAQLKVLLTEDLRDGAGLREAAVWLGVDPDWQPDVSGTRNVSGAPRNKAVATAYKLRRQLRPWLKPIVPDALQRRVDGVLAKGLERQSMAPETRAKLIEIFRPDIELLARLLDRDLSAWLQ
jgi:hypothetical protein